MSEATAVLRGLTFAALALCLGGCYHAAQNLSDSLDAGAIARSTDGSGAVKYSVAVTTPRRTSATPSLSQRVREFEARFGSAPPRPENWGGYRLRPEAIEFWQGRADRLHDRLLYRREGERWNRVRLAP